MHRVDARAAIQVVGVAPSGQGVVSTASEQRILALAALQRVVLVGAGDAVPEIRSDRVFN